MRKEYLFRSILSFLIFIFISFFSINTNPKSGKVEFSGTYYVGQNHFYKSLTELNSIFEAINNNVVTGNITILIDCDLNLGSLNEFGTHPLNQWNELGTGGYTITIQPKEPRNMILEGFGTGGMIRLNGADRVIIDGNYNGSGNYLIFKHKTADGNPLITFLNASNNCVIKNCIFEGNNPSSTSGCISLLETGSEGNNNNNLITNNIIRSVEGFYSLNLIYSMGINDSKPNKGNVIQNNILYNFSNAAINIRETGNEDWSICNNEIYLGNQVTFSLSGIVFNSKGISNLISQNIIRDIKTSNICNGIKLEDARNTIVTRNKIYSLSTPASTSLFTGISNFGATGKPTSVSIINNFISLIPSASSNQNIYGIRDKGFYGNSIKVYNNTIYIGGSSSGTSNSWAYFRQNGCPTTSTIKNNIFFNGRTGGSANHFAIGDESARTGTGTDTFAVANNLYVGLGSTPRNFFDRTNSTTATPRDSNYWITNTGDYYSYLSVSTSITASNLFNSISTGNLSINSSTSTSTSWAVKGKGVSLSEVQEDFWGNSRTTTSGVPIDIGAHEFQHTTEPTIITITPSAGDNHFNYLGRTLATINFSQNGTLPTSLNLQYYSGVQAPNSNSNCINSHWIITPTEGNGYNFSLKLNTVPSEHNQILSNTFKVANSNDNGNKWNIIPGTIS